MNIIAKILPNSAKSTSKTAEISLYGTVGSYELSANDIKKQLEDLSANGVKEVVFRVHSPGGSVLEGFAIKNIIAGCGMKTKVIIEGIAASMMTVCMLGADSVEAHANTRIMVHQANVGIQGGAEDLRKSADMLDSINKQLAQAYALKTGKTEDYITSNWLNSGDKWFTAAQALQEGLIDAVITEKSPAIKSESNNILEILATATAYYESRHESQNFSNVENSNTTKTPKKMSKKTEILAILAGAGVLNKGAFPFPKKEDDKEETASGASEDEEAERQFDAIKEGVKSLLAKVESYKKKAQVSEEKALSTEMEKKKMPTKQAEAFMALAQKTSFEEILAIVTAMPEVTPIASAIHNTSPKANGTPEDRSAWGYKEYSEKAPTELLALQTEDPAKFEALLEDFLK